MKQFEVGTVYVGTFDQYFDYYVNAKCVRRTEKSVWMVFSPRSSRRLGLAKFGEEESKVAMFRIAQCGDSESTTQASNRFKGLWFHADCSKNNCLVSVGK